MKCLPLLVLVLIGLVLKKKAFSQDSLYAKKIDSLWLHSYEPGLLSEKRSKIGNAKIQYNFYRRPVKMRCIVSLNKTEGENLIFFFMDDRLVMISPSGQDPYYILDDRLEYGKSKNHSIDQISELITRAYQYLKLGYILIKGESMSLQFNGSINQEKHE